MTSTIRVLVIESEDEIANLLCSMISIENNIEIDHSYTLGRAISLINETKYDVVITNLVLFDANSHQIVEQISLVRQTLPIIFISQKSTLSLLTRTLRLGAQDFIPLSTCSIDQLQKAILVAVERSALISDLYELIIIDELTQLYNRRGFERLGQNQLRLAKRSKENCCLAFIDLDNLKLINDTLGHTIGDKAIQDVAIALKSSLRTTDIIARLGGDEFLVLLPNVKEAQAKILLERFTSKLVNKNKRKKAVYSLSASIGIVEFNFNSEVTLEQLQDIGCSRMYKVKNKKKVSRK
jgi:diguanylate cyclase (GGDEF)-like protein